MTSKKPPSQNQPSLWSEDSLANQYQSLESREGKMMIDGFSHKCFESLRRLNPNGSLQRMSKIFLTSQMEKSCKEFTMTWRLLITKSKLSVLVLHRKEHGTEEKEYGSLPTPRSCDLEGGVVKNVEINNGSFSRKNKKGVRYGVKLKDALHHLEKKKMYGTPKAQDERAALTDRGKTNLGEQIHGKYNVKKNGGRLNPNFVEFLLGYNMDWTKVEPKE